MTPTIDALPMEEIDRLEALAKKAEGWGWHEILGVFFAGDAQPLSTSEDYWRHATACSPEQTLALCAQARRTVTAEAERDEARRERDEHKDARAQFYSKWRSEQAEADALREKVERLEAELGPLDDNGCRVCNNTGLTRDGQHCLCCGRAAALREKVEGSIKDGWHGRAAALLPTPDAGTGEERQGDPLPLYEQAVEAVRSSGKASVSSIQRALNIGYNRAAGLVEQMEAEGIVSAPDRYGARQLVAPTTPGAAR